MLHKVAAVRAKHLVVNINSYLKFNNISFCILWQISSMYLFCRHDWKPRVLLLVLVDHLTTTSIPSFPWQLVIAVEQIDEEHQTARCS